MSEIDKLFTTAGPPVRAGRLGWPLGLLHAAALMGCVAPGPMVAARPLPPRESALDVASYWSDTGGLHSFERTDEGSWTRRGKGNFGPSLAVAYRYGVREDVEGGLTIDTWPASVTTDLKWCFWSSRRFALAIDGAFGVGQAFDFGGTPSSLTSTWSPANPAGLGVGLRGIAQWDVASLLSVLVTPEYKGVGLLAPFEDADYVRYSGLLHFAGGSLGARLRLESRIHLTPSAGLLVLTNDPNTRDGLLVTSRFGLAVQLSFE